MSTTNHKLATVPLLKLLTFLIQLVLGSAAWFYVIAVAFTHPLFTGSLIVPVLVAVAGSGISSGLLSCRFPEPIYLPAAVYSTAFWLWAVFAAASQPDIFTLSFWGGLASSVFLCGIAGSLVAKLLKKCRISLMNNRQR